MENSQLFVQGDIFYLSLDKQPTILSLKGLRSAALLSCREPHALKSLKHFGKTTYRNIKPLLLKLLKKSECLLPINFNSFQCLWKTREQFPRDPEWGQLCTHSLL